RLGEGEFIVVEADESDGSFNRLNPSVAVITNMDREHIDHYGSQDALEAAFLTFANKVPFYGVTILCGQDPILKRLREQISRRVVTYGFGAEHTYSIIDYQFDSNQTRFVVRTSDG